MSLKGILWSSYLGPSPPLPYDVIFNIIEEGKITGSIGAHRYLLSTCSPVLCTEFFGLLADRGRVIDIKETRFHAFRYLVDYIYGINRKLEIDKEAQELFEILNIAERYDVQKLKENMIERLNAMQICAKNVMEVARVAEVYYHFNTVSDSILSSCSKLLKKLLATDAELTESCNRELQSDIDRKLVIDLIRMEDDLELKHDVRDSTQELPRNKKPQEKGPDKEAPPANLREVNWVELRDPNNGIPPDVCFKIIEPSREVLKEETKIVGEVLAHKYLLAACSESFKRMFFDHYEPKSSPCHLIETIQLECSSLSAFKVMINYIYGKYPTLRGAEEICELFEIVDLAERFTISGLEEEYKTAMFLYFREAEMNNSAKGKICIITSLSV